MFPVLLALVKQDSTKVHPCKAFSDYGVRVNGEGELDALVLGEQSLC